MPKGGLGVGDLPNLVKALVVVGIFVALGILLMAEAQTQVGLQTMDTDEDGVLNATEIASPSDAYTAVGTASDAVGDIPGWLPIIVIIIVIALVIGYVAYIR